MRKVKNTKVIHRIADRTRKAGKSRNIIAVLAIALTTLLFTSVFIVGGSIIKKTQEATMRQVGGSSHAGYKYLTQAEYDLVKEDEKLKDVTYRILVADAVNDSLKKLHTEVSYYEDLDAVFSFCYPEVGNMPEKENEIVTSDLVLEAMGLPCEIGIEVPLTLNIGGEIVEDTFVLSGYFKGDVVSSAQVIAVSKEYANKVAPTPTTSVMENAIDPSDYTGRIMADFNFNTSINLEKQVKALNERLGFPENAPVGINWAYMGNSVDVETIFMIAALLFIIVLSGYLIIYNIFYMNVCYDIRYYGLLKTIGTTGKQIRQIVRRQAYMLSLYGIPLGMICGVFVGKIALPVIMSQISFSEDTSNSIVFNPWIFIGAAIFSFITVYLSCMKPCKLASGVTPVEAVKYTEGQETKTKRKTKKTKKVTLGKMALENMKRSKKKATVVIASLSLALVLLNSIYSLIAGFNMDKFLKYMAVSDYTVQDATLDNVSVSSGDRAKDGVTKEFLQELSMQEGIEEIGNIYVKELYVVTFTEEDYAKIEDRVLNNPEVKEILNQYMADLGEEYVTQILEERWIDGKIYGIGELVMNQLENSNGDLDWEKFRTGKYVITTRYDAEGENAVDYFLPGETVTLFNEAGESREYEVLAVADMPYSCGLQTYGMFNCNYILPEEEYLDFMGEAQPMRTLFNAEAEKETQIEEWLSSYCENVNDELDYTSKYKLEKEFASMRNMYTFIGGLLSFVLALIGILNFINTMVTSVLSRKQEFAMMEAVGMTGNQLKKMLCQEGLYYALFTGVCSVVLSALLNVTVVRLLGNEFWIFAWHFTVTPVLICIPLLMLIVFIVPIICYQKMCRTSVVERMRKVE